jgi:hypothetical protein
MPSHHPIWWISFLLPFAVLPWGLLVSAADPCDPKSNYRFQLTHSLKSFDTRRMSAWSGGGGPIWQLENDTGNPFAGRNFGSGDRRTIFGSRAYGSGYPAWSFFALDPATVAGRGFPYGVWPIPWSGNYSGSAEYGAETAELFRPGGQVVQAPLRPTPASGNYSSVEGETYWLIGDRGSTLSILTNMVNWCRAEPIWPEFFEPADNATGVAGNNTGQGVKFHPGNVLQYYRASTFALAHPKYNNTYAHPPFNTSTLLTHDQSTPLDDVMKYSPWLRCINATIADALPLLDMPPTKDTKNFILAAVLCSIFMGPCALGFLYSCSFRMIDKLIITVRRTRAEKKAILRRRTEVDEFQLYP